ncbi:MAG TPA: SCO family protein [Chitinophagaceae bacterium]|nr:SCO family protein [Chitinophagaceae bacterium]
MESFSIKRHIQKIGGKRCLRNIITKNTTIEGMNIIIVMLSFLFLSATCKTETTSVIDNKKVTISDESIFNLSTTWHTEEDKTIQLSDLKGKVLVIVMIYTSCKVACPRLVADMKDIRSKIPSELNDKIQYVLVSIDPEHDTPKKLKEFAINKEMDGEEWTFLQGDPESVREFANVLSVKYKEISPMDFSHSNIISVFNPKGELLHQQEGLGVNNETTISTIIKTAKQK